MTRRFHIQQEKQGGQKLLTIFFTAGYPSLYDTLALVRAVEEAGADLIEIGMPYSDPLADGPLIQQTSAAALQNGMTLSLLFEQLEELRPKSEIPVYLMGYFNPMLQFGVEKFLAECQRVGIDGLIVPDIPLDEYEEKYEELFKKYDVGITFLVLPQTPPERLKLIDRLCTDFIYAVSNPSTTGGKLSIGDAQRAYYHRIEQAGLDTPVQIGFGISDKESFESATEHFAGGIIGSAFIRALQQEEDYVAAARRFVCSIRGDEK